MPRDLDALTPAQRAAVTHDGGPLLVLGGPGTGKTRVLVERTAWLAANGVAPEDVLLVGGSPAPAAALRVQVEDALEQPFGELAVHTVPDLAARLLREEPAAVGLDPFFVPVTAADRLALLLDRVDQLTLRRHDFLGNRAALLASVIERIDRCKLELVTAADYARWAEQLEGETAEREREFAQLFADHDRLLAEQGTLDVGDLVLRAIDLLDDPAAGDRCRARFEHVLVDEYEDLDLAHLRLIDLLGEHGRLTVAGDDDAAIKRFRGAATKNLRGFTATRPQARVIALDRSFRSRQRILSAAQAVTAPVADRLKLPVEAAPGGDVAFWRCANERAQAQGVAADVERLIREGVRPDRIAVLVRSVRNEGHAVSVALEERAVPFRVVGAAAFFQRAEVRDVLAWLRLLVDPSDANAAVRALARPPVELRAADLARCIQIARRRKLDMVGALVAATESPQLPPEARERILAFLKLHRQFAGALDTTRPDLFVHRLVERLGLRRQQLFAANADVVERLTNLARLGELAAHYVRRAPQGTPREFARSIAAVAEAGLREEEPDRARGPLGVAVMTMRSAKGREFDHVFVLGLHSARMPGARRHAYEPLPDALLHERLPPDSRAAHVAEMRRLLQVAMTRATRGLVLAYAEHSDRGALQPPSPFVEEARQALGAEWEEHAEQLFGPDETLHATFRQLRDELLEEVPRVGTRLGELRFDTDLDVAHATVRYLELVKIAALLERPAGQSVAEALPNVNARLLEATTAQQKDILLSSSLDEAVLEAERDQRARAASTAARAEPSLEPFLPKRGDGLMLSASDIETYRTCPLKYKFARVFRIPQEPTLNQRFGIVVHQVLERYHAGNMQSLEEMTELLETGWRRSGFGFSDEERQLHGKARAALERYWERWRADPAEPVWFERQFSFRLGPHMLRGRVDRVDRLPDGQYELIDYKTGRPKTPAQLRDDVQLAVYALAAREAWDLEASQQSYLYVLDDEKVPLPPAAVDREWVSDTVLAVGEGILAQGFEPTPSYAACSMCDYRIVCPAAER
ncbi:MAG TPA: ATP-dependent DNA helicase [Solirubrobacteraceae bacterium]|nr:ATP-dependent DNA helicase [Solirubrobacteraceae bacterium]